ncbi:ATP-binding protein [Vibrio harveyi]|uniref:AAA family ATPase n=1 Tax=Vibrio harveyi TaxID=669 RepID=UPI00234C6312|nr:ATP-binding protein [Vibrio harveyi]WCP78958.1 ATP-binding protein [Vibrio harveyi]
MLIKLWGDIPEYTPSEEQYLALKKLNFLIGTNNSGKSRLLRTLFSKPEESLSIAFDTFNLKEEYEKDIKLLKSLFQTASSSINSLTSQKLEVLDKDIFTYDERRTLSSLSSEVDRLRFNNGYSNARDFNVPRAHEELNNFKDRERRICFDNIEVPSMVTRYYIPVLRGLRPLIKETDSYKQRTISDYFEKELEDHILTGFDLYSLLVQYLLGTPENRQLIRDYEKKLSTFFFDGKEVTLIPEFGKDTVAVKIGDEPQFPIFDLGDGLQQIIIISSHTFLNNEESLYFIEEPEIYLHPGLLRKLIYFLSEQTPHQYLMTTHSNHLFDMADDRDDVSIQKVKKVESSGSEVTFKIDEVSRDKALLLELGVKPSSVYLANCTIWVEGVTDRFYLRSILKRYLNELEISDPATYSVYKNYSENTHYSYVEYQGGVLSHWNFDTLDVDNGDIAGLSAMSISSSTFLIADGDIKDKGNRAELLSKQLKEQIHITSGKEIENYLPDTILKATVKKQFASKRKNKQGIDIDKIDGIQYSDYVSSSKGIGHHIDSILGVDSSSPLFSEQSGTIKDKVNFCLTALEVMKEQDWELTEELSQLCNDIFHHIDKNNNL